MASLTAELLPQIGGTGKYHIRNIIFTEQTLLEPGKQFMSIAPNLGINVRELIAAGHDVLIDESQLSNTSLTLDNLEVIQNDDFKQAKRLEIFRLKNKFSYSMTMISALDFFAFYTSFSELLIRGYNINDNNRDEKYLEIVDTGDDDLITLLQTYVESSDKINTLHLLHKNIQTYIKDIEAAETPEEFGQITESYSF